MQLPDVHDDATLGSDRQANSFRLSAGEAELVDYQPDNIHHVFCKNCGVRSFGWGENSDLGGKFYAVRVNCLDGVDVDELVNAADNLLRRRK